MFPVLQTLIADHPKKPVLKSLWAIGILTIIVFSIIFIDRLFELIRGFDELRLFARQVRQLIEQIAEWDKVVHFSVYGVVALIGFIAVSKQKYRFWIAGGMIAMGIALEIVQLMVPGRSFEFFDWFADVLGVTLSYALFRFAMHIRSPGRLT